MFNNEVYKEFDITTPNYTWVEYVPDFNDTNVAYTGNPAKGRYQRVGNTIFWHAEVQFDQVTNFGTGGYYITVPVPSAHHTDSSSGALHDVSTGKTHGIKGHYEQYSNQVFLFYVNNQIEDEPFTHNAPVTLATDDYIHICGWYEGVL